MPEPIQMHGTDPDGPVTRLLIRAQDRLRFRAVLLALGAGLITFAAILITARALVQPMVAALVLAPPTAALVAAFTGALAVRGWTPARLAALIERHTPSLENLLIVAEELPRKGMTVPPVLAGEIERQVAARIAQVSLPSILPLGQPVLVLAAGCIAFAGYVWAPRPAAVLSVIAPATADATSGAVITSIQVRVDAPRYTGLSRRDWTDPTEVRVVEGSRVTIDVAASAPVELVRADGGTTRLEAQGDRHRIELSATETQFVVLRLVSVADARSRSLALLVDPDRPPQVRIEAPARDLVFARPDGRIEVTIEASDDLGLASLELRYTKVAGSGETFTFDEGTSPLTLKRNDERTWTATSTLSLAALGIAERETLVYRAVVRDTRPGRDPVSSESYVIELSGLAEASSSGLSIPDDRERQAISQQVVIAKTEELLRTRSTLAAATVTERSQALAVEQRMVKAEFVFMTGGEVQDEVEEAEHAHELVEGRQENKAQVELFAAIREMSRAERALNDGDVPAGLAFERSALAALQRAFDRRRYLLRTVPERARLDLSRRLSGEQDQARSWVHDPPPADLPPALRELRDLQQQLSVSDGAAEHWTAVASRLAAVHPADAEVQRVAARLAATAADPAARLAAIAEAARLVARLALTHLLPSLTAPLETAPVLGYTGRSRAGQGRR